MICFQGAVLVSVVAYARALQIPSNLVDAGPEQPLKDVQLPGTHEVYSNVKRQAVELQNAIEIQENVSLQEMHSRRSEFAKQLVMQQKTIEADELINNATQDKLRSVRKAIEQLRGEAVELITQNEALANQLKVMQKNISTALEFVRASVLYAVQRTGLDPNLEVLSELRQQDEEHARSQELNDFDRLASVSMLITGNATSSAATTPEDFVNILRSNLGEAVAERNASRAKLDSTFRMLYSQGGQRHAWVLRMKDKLNQSLLQDTAMKERLEQAVSNLRQSREVLSDKVEALRRFGRERLGEEALQPAVSAVHPVPERLRSSGHSSAERETFEVTGAGSMDDYPQSVRASSSQGDAHDFVDQPVQHDLRNASLWENFADGEAEPSLHDSNQNAKVDVETAADQAPEHNLQNGIHRAAEIGVDTFMDEARF